MEYFLDTSAWIKRYTGEKGFEKIDELIENENIVILDLEIPELISNLFRIKNEGYLSDNELNDLIDVVYSDISNFKIIRYAERHIFLFEQLCRIKRQTAIDGLIILCAKERENICIYTSDENLKKGAELHQIKILDC